MGQPFGSESQMPRMLRRSGSGADSWRETVDSSGRICYQIQVNGVWTTKARLDRSGNLDVAGVVNVGVVF